MRSIEEKILEDINSAIITSKRAREQGKKIAFTNGCFDILHAGHIKTFIEAKKNADILFVGINTDDSVRKIKGEKRPVIPLNLRKIVVAACEFVDYVVPFSDETPYKLIVAIEPDIIVKGEDWEEDKIVGADFVKSKGGKVLRVKLVEGISTTNIIQKIIDTFK